MKKKSLFNQIIFLINSLFASLLLLSFMLPFVSPRSIPVFAVLSLLVPVLVFVNVFFGLYWLIKLKKQVLLTLFVLAISWFVTPPIFKFSDRNTARNSDIKIMSYNVRAFNRWNWIDEKEIPKKITNFITEKSPDILVLQEFFRMDNLQLTYPYKFVKTKSKKEKQGLAIFSKFPIIQSGSLNFKDTSNNVIFADILREQDTIRVYNIHLQSLKIKTNQENFGQENSDKLLAVLKDGFVKQANQTSFFLAHEKQWKGKKIIAGDFNNTSFSWVYNQIIFNKKDAFIEAGKGFGKTFNYWFPMRIDFILTDKNAKVNQFLSFSKKNSDHFPIMARINW